MVIENYHTIFKAFEKKYAKLPGIMAIVEDDILNDTILVYIDRDAFKPTSIPAKFQDAHIDIIDAREQYSALSAAFDKIKEAYKDNLTATPVTHFGGMIDFLKIIIDLYELKLSEEGEHK